MFSPRKLVQLLMILGILFVGGFVFYKFFPEIWGDVVYPLEYREEILKASDEFDLDRNLIAAIIFTESHFNPDAGSGAGARGLMQLMPPTARGVARQLGMTDYSDSKILDPAINVRLGSAYMRSAIDSRKGNIDVALANYNAGPKYAGLYEISFDRSVLPRETDNYLRKVRGAWEAYDRIYGVNWEGPTKPFNVSSEKNFVSQIDIKNLVNTIFGR